MNFHFKTGFSAAMCALALSTAPAMAREAPTSRVVSHADLDLTTQQGQKEFDSRVDAAAREVCGIDTGMTSTMNAEFMARVCHSRAKKGAQQAIAQLKNDGQRYASNDIAPADRDGRGHQGL